MPCCWAPCCGAAAAGGRPSLSIDITRQPSCPHQQTHHRTPWLRRKTGQTDEQTGDRRTSCRYIDRAAPTVWWTVPTGYGCVFRCSVMTGDLNGAGRGLNLVVVNPDTKEVVRISRFDTFSSGSAHASFFCFCEHATSATAVVKLGGPTGFQIRHLCLRSITSNDRSCTSEWHLFAGIHHSARFIFEYIMHDFFLLKM